MRGASVRQVNRRAVRETGMLHFLFLRPRSEVWVIQELVQKSQDLIHKNQEMKSHVSVAKAMRERNYTQSVTGKASDEVWIGELQSI